MVIFNKILIGGSKHGKLDQKLHMLKIPFQNMRIFKNKKKKLESFSSFILKTSMPPLGLW